MAEIHPNDIGLATFADVGDVEKLKTSAKNVVDALNEIYQNGTQGGSFGEQWYVDGENNVIIGENNIVYGSNNLIIGSDKDVYKRQLINGINSVTGAVGIPAIPTFTAPQIPMLANGGLIRTAGTVIVGEKGPEMLSLPSGAKVTPIDKSRRSENKFYISIYADGKSADEIVDELMPKLRLALDNL